MSEATLLACFCFCFNFNSTRHHTHTRIGPAARDLRSAIDRCERGSRRIEELFVVCIRSNTSYIIRVRARYACGGAYTVRGPYPTILHIPAHCILKATYLPTTRPLLPLSIPSQKNIRADLVVRDPKGILTTKSALKMIMRWFISSTAANQRPRPAHAHTDVLIAIHIHTCG